MPGIYAITNTEEMLLDLAAVKADVADVPVLLRIAGELMRASIARTFRDEGSPAGSWPALALSTMRRKEYTGGHKLLILSGRLFGSITDVVSGGTLTIGTNLVYAAVQQYGSADRRGAAIGPQARIPGREIQVDAHDSTRTSFNRRGQRVIGPEPGQVGRTGARSARFQGPAKQTKFAVKAHARFQNIPPRPYVVFRPEDPARIMDGFQAYLGGKLVRIGTVTA